MIEDADSCFTRNTANALNDKIIGVDAVACNIFTVKTHEWHDSSDCAFDDTQSLTSQTLDWLHQEPETQCSAYPTIVSTAAGSNTIAAQCFNYEGTLRMGFDPPTVTDPAICTDAIWYYSTELSPSSIDSPFPANFVLSVNSVTNEINWGTADGLPLGYDPSNDYGTY